MRASAKIIAFNTVVLVLLGVGAQASAQVPPLNYTVTTIHGSTNRSNVGTLGVPTFVNVDATPEPDLIVQVAGAPEPNVIVDVSVTALKAISDLAVELTYVISGFKLHLGYDARGTVAPMRWDVVAVVARNLSSVDLNMVTTLPPRVMKVFGRADTMAATNRTVIDISAELDPFPTIFRAFARNNDEHTLLDLRPGTPTKATARLLALISGKAVEARATIDQVPDILSFDLVDRAAPQGPLVVFNSSADIARIEATGRILESDDETNFSGILTAISARRIEFDQAADDRVSIRFPSGGSIGLTELNLARRGPFGRATPPSLVGDDDFVDVIQRDTDDYLFVRVRVANLGPAQIANTQPAPTGFPIVELSWGDPLVIKLQRRGPAILHVLVETDAEVVLGEVRDVPAWAHVEYQKNVRLFFNGERPIDSIQAAIVAKSGHSVFGRARQVFIAVEQVPTDLSLSLVATSTPLTSRFTMNALDKTVGLVDVRMTGSPSLAIVPGDEGVLYVDRPDQYVVHARVRSLSKAMYENTGICISGSCGSRLTVEVVTTRGGFPFVVDATPRGSDQTIASIARRPAAARMEILKQEDASGRTTRTDITWTANAAAQELTVSTPAARRFLRIRPLPSRLRFCLQRGSNFCSEHGRDANEESISLISGDPEEPSTNLDRTTIDYQECDEEPCFRKDGKWTLVENLSVERFRAALHDGAKKEIYVDTEGRLMSGRVRIQDGSADRHTDMEINLPAGFKATDRLVVIDGASVKGKNPIDCPSGTRLFSWISDPTRQILEALGWPPPVLELMPTPKYWYVDLHAVLCDAEIPFLP